MELFDDINSMVLEEGAQSELSELESFFNRAYTVEEIKPFLMDIWPVLTDNTVVIRNGKRISAEKYFPSGKKISGYRKNELVKLLSLLHSHPDNLSRVLQKLPKYVSVAIATSLKLGYAGEMILKKEGASDAIVKRDMRHYWWYNKCSEAKYLRLFYIIESKPHDDAYFEQYLYIPVPLKRVYSEALLGDITFDGMFSETASPNTSVMNAEREFASSFPVITGMHKQQLIKCSVFKMGTASAAKVMKNISIPEIIPQKIVAEQKINLGQYFLPYVVYALCERKTGTIEDYAKDVFALLKKGYADYLLSGLLPHIKGFRANVLSKMKNIEWGDLIGAALLEEPDKWLSLESFRDYIYTCPGDYFVGCPLSDFSAMPLINTITGKSVFLDDQCFEIDMEAIRATAAVMYAIGMIEVALTTSPKEPSTPCGNISQIRLTGLGKYVLGLTKSYETELSSSKEWFRLDSEHLIVNSVSADNPYEGLLSEIATQIGRGRYVIDSGSFLKTCNSVSDVRDKIAFFKDYICSDPPELWKTFFNSLKSRCNPFVNDKETYCLLKIGDSNNELVHLLTTDWELRKMIVLVEGQRLLVKKSDMDKFSRLLKSRGYLI